MLRTFYSFSMRENGPLVKRLATTLEDRGYRPTICVDRHIRVHQWRTRLAEALHKSDVSIVIITPNTSSNPYVMGELWASRVLSQIQPRFVVVPVLIGYDRIPDFLTDLYVANAKGKEIDDIGQLALEIDMIVKDNLLFELSISDVRPRVFIGHGHAQDWQIIKTYLIDTLDLAVEEYNQVSPVGKPVQVRLEEMLTASSFAIVVMSPDDRQLDESMHARQNVIHEVGLCQGKFGFQKVIVLRENQCEPFTNISGLNEIRYDSKNIDSVLPKIKQVLEREGIIPKH